MLAFQIIISRATDQNVITFAAFEFVISGTPQQDAVTAAGLEMIVTVTAVDPYRQLNFLIDLGLVLALAQQDDQAVNFIDVERPLVAFVRQEFGFDFDQFPVLALGLDHHIVFAGRPHDLQDTVVDPDTGYQRLGAAHDRGRVIVMQAEADREYAAAGVYMIARHPPRSLVSVSRQRLWPIDSGYG